MVTIQAMTNQGTLIQLTGTKQEPDAQTVQVYTQEGQPVAYLNKKGAYTNGGGYWIIALAAEPVPDRDRSRTFANIAEVQRWANSLAV